MANNATFWNKIAENYAKKPISNQSDYEKKLQMTQQYFNQDMSVLEYGCGTGSTALIHAPFVKKYLGTDISDNMLNIAKQKLAKTDLDNLEFKTTSIEQLANPSESFDAVLAMSIIHLVDNPERSIKRSYELLKPNGIFVSSTPCISGFWKALKLILPIGKRLGLLPNIHFFPHEKLVEQIESAGFVIEKHWISENNKMVSFIIARKPENAL